MSKKIPLTGKYGDGRFAIVDDGAYEVLSAMRWHVQPQGYAVMRPSWGTIYMHRVVAGAVGGDLIDHIDGDKLNNTSSNLRKCDKSINALNKHDKQAGRPYTSKYRGVSWSKTMKAWLARINIKNKAIDIGYFDSEDVAYEAYCREQAKYINGAL
jgi:hypothetical protein